MEAPKQKPKIRVLSGSGRVTYSPSQLDIDVSFVPSWPTSQWTCLLTSTLAKLLHHDFSTLNLHSDSIPDRADSLLGSTPSVTPVKPLRTPRPPGHYTE